jgi:DNA-binding GntR family transcriptional regulator
MTKEEAVTLLCEHFSEGLVRTIVDAITEKEREECAKVCDEHFGYMTGIVGLKIRARGDSK